MFAQINQVKRIFYSLLLIFLIVSCRKHKDAIPTPTAPSSSQARITGVVKDQTGAPISGVTITAHGRTAFTGEHGEFNLISGAENDRIYVKAEMNGYFTGTATEIAASDGTTNVQIVLATQEIAATLDASVGGTAQDSEGNEVAIPSDGVVTESGSSYSGDVNVSLLHLDPNSPEFGLLTQGADMVATNTAGAEGALYSYGVLKVELSDNSGNELQLAPGKTSTVRMSIAPEQLSTAPATIPLWYFDENSGKWVEDGFATKTGNEYVGTVTHFTDWNCDVFSFSQATVTGKVVDCSGKPVPYIYIQSGQSYAYTDQHGIYTRRVPSEMAFEVKAENSYWQNYTSSASISIPALSAGQTYSAPDLVLNECIITVSGTLKGCGGSDISGYVEVNGNFAFAENGRFSCVVGGNSDSIQIVAYDFQWGFSSKQIDLPVGANNIDAGEFVVCMDYMTPGENSFTASGDVNGFISLNIISNDLNGYSYTYGQYYNYQDTSINSFSNNLYLTSSGYNENQNVIIDFSFYDDQMVGTGQYPMSNSSVWDSINANNNFNFGYIYFVTNNNNDWVQYQSESGTVNITRIDAVGGLIEGTFSGTYRSEGASVYNPADSSYTYTPGDKVITVTNGKFSMLRYPDWDYNYKISTDDLSAKVLASRKKRHIK